MIPNDVRNAVSKGLGLLPPRMTSPEAKVMLFAIGLQESRFQHRFQAMQGQPGLKGPARGFWQFERGGCKGVVDHAASRYWLHHVCQVSRVEFTAPAIWTASENNDVLAAVLARLLLFTDHKKLPEVGDEKGAWQLYIRTWRPGKPHPKTWSGLYEEAAEAVL